MGKVKIKEEQVDAKEDTFAENNENEEETYETKVEMCNAVAVPMASQKTCGRIYKLIRKASKDMRSKKTLYQGLKQVQRVIRKGEHGLVIFAGDVFPIEIMCHMPAVCEEKDLPYIFTPSRKDLGSALGVGRTAIMMMVKECPEYQDTYDKVLADVRKAHARLEMAGPSLRVKIKSENGSSDKRVHIKEELN